MKLHFLPFLFLLFAGVLQGSPVFGSRTVSPQDATERGIQITFFEYEDGRVLVSATLNPKGHENLLDIVGFAQLVAASYLDSDQTKLIATNGRKMELNKSGLLHASVMLHRERLRNVEIWIEFGNGDGYVRFDINSFYEHWKNQTENNPEVIIRAKPRR